MDGTMPVAMTPAQWNKPNSQTKEHRLDILVKAIKAGTKLVTVDNKEIVVKNDKNNLRAIEMFKKDNKPFDLLLKSGRKISSSQIGKSAVFGGGGAGKGGGTLQTALAESLQCLYCAAVMGEPVNKPISHFTPSILKKHAGKANLGGTTFNAAIELDETWHLSAYWTAALTRREGYIKSNHTYHRDDAQMKKIYKAKSAAFKNSGMLVLSDDKWNPGDIWAIDRSAVLDKVLDDTTITNLNTKLKEEFDKRKIVGISLKKVVDEKRIRSSVLNDGKRPLDKHKLTSASLMADNISTATFFRSKGATLLVDQNIKIGFRTPSYLGPLNAEIELATARGGRAGFTQIIDAANRYMRYSIPDNNALKQEAKKIMDGDEDTIKAFSKMATFCANVTDIDFRTELKAQDIDRIHSKLGSTYVVYGLKKANKNKADEFVSYIMNYAGSKLEESSVYVKVYQ